MKKRITALFLAWLLLVGLSVSAFATEQSPEQIPLLNSAEEAFVDVSSTDWFFEDVNALYLGRIIGGFGDNTFRPQNTVTASQSLKMILRAVGIAEQVPTDSHWASGYYQLALSNGYLASTDIAGLDVPISRVLVAKLAANALGLPASQTAGTFTDTSDGFVQALYEISILGGYPDGTFHPNSSLTRAELSAIVHRINTYVSMRMPQSEQNANNSEFDLSKDVTVKASSAALDYIKQSEGFTKTAYWDYSQYSIGYGSSCKVDDFPNGITQEQAVILLKQHVKKIEDALDSFLLKNNIMLQPHQYDALVCFSYNIGTSWLDSSKLATLLKQSHFNTADVSFVNAFASAMGVWCHIGSSDPQINSALIERRVRDIKMFLYADYTGKTSSAKFCSVTFSSVKGKVSTDIAFYLAGSTYTPFDYTATSADGDTFQGWQAENGMVFNPLTHPVSEDIRLTAIWAGSAQPVPFEPISNQGTPGYIPWPN